MSGGAPRVLARPILTANLRARQRTTQHRADVADVKCSGAQRENTPGHGHDTERVVPIHVADYEEHCAGGQAKDSTCRTVDES